MGSKVLDPVLREAIDEVAAGLDAVFAAGLAPHDARDAVTMIRDLEAQGRRMDAAQVALLGEVDRGKWFRPDGHASAKVMVRHIGHLSEPEAKRRASVARALRDLPEVSERFEAGRIGFFQAQRIARVYANTRVRAALVRKDRTLARLAEQESYQDFDSNSDNQLVGPDDAPNDDSAGSTGPDATRPRTRQAGSAPEPGTPRSTGCGLSPKVRGSRGVGYRCSTLDRTPVDPREAFAAALIGHIRRVVGVADSVTIVPTAAAKVDVIPTIGLHLSAGTRSPLVGEDLKMRFETPTPERWIVATQDRGTMILAAPKTDRLVTSARHL